MLSVTEIAGGHLVLPRTSPWGNFIICSFVFSLPIVALFETFYWPLF